MFGRERQRVTERERDFMCVYLIISSDLLASHLSLRHGLTLNQLPYEKGGEEEEWGNSQGGGGGKEEDDSLRNHC